VAVLGGGIVTLNDTHYLAGVKTILRAAVLGALVVAPTAFAATGEGIVLRVEPGYAIWSLDANHIQKQLSQSSVVPAGDVQSMLVDQANPGAGLTLGLGYNIKGHATISMDLSGTGWDLAKKQRGGAGFGALEAAWHPLQLVPLLGDRKFDVSVYGGAGYFIMGEQRALDGLHLQVGARAEYFLTPMVSAGLALRYFSLQSRRYSVDWDNHISVPLPDGSGGGLFMPSLTLALHVPVI
jgi:hypothetical protein